MKSQHSNKTKLKRRWTSANIDPAAWNSLRAYAVSVGQVAGDVLSQAAVEFVARHSKRGRRTNGDDNGADLRSSRDSA